MGISRCMFGFIVLFGAVNVCEAQLNGHRKCSVRPSERKKCTSGKVLTKSACEDLGCCYEDNNIGAPTCFKGTCAQHVDLVFAIDASGSIKKNGYEQIKEFTKDFIDNFDIGVEKTHVGIVTFSEVANVQIKLTETFNRDLLYNKIDKLDYPGYRTAVDDALRVVDKEMFSLRGGVRQGVPQVLIFLTDGKCNICREDVSSVVKPLKERGVNIYTVGVTNAINRTELEIISSEPSNQHMFTVDTFDQLKPVIVKMKERSCVVKKGKCARPKPPFECRDADDLVEECTGDGFCSGNQKCCFDGCSKKCQFPLANCLTAIDVAFALDSSNETNSTAFEKMKRYASQIVDSFEVSQKDARFASLTYSSRSEKNFDFISYDTGDDIKNALQSLPYGQAESRIDLALERAHSEIFNLRRGKVRTRRPMVLVIFFDGKLSQANKNLQSVAAPLKAQGVKLVAIGVTSGSNSVVLNEVISSKNSLFEARNFAKLLPELYEVAKEACNEKPGRCEANLINTNLSCTAVANECENDFDCHGIAKCCLQGCENKCIMPPEVCRRSVDIAFAVHEDIKETELEHVKSFLFSSIDSFSVSADGTHVALLTFGKEAKLQFDFNIGQPKKSLINLFHSLKIAGGGKGKLEDAVKLSHDVIFSAAGGMRENLPKILVIVTGPVKKSSNPNVLKDPVTTLRNRGVDIIVIGVGDVDSDVMKSVTGATKREEIEDRVWLSKYYSGITQYVQDITSFACSEAGNLLPPEGETTKEKGSPPCGGTPNTCIKGPKGSMGRRGSLGELGKIGQRGEVGPRGIPGPKGPAGLDGKMGRKGERGLKGVIGMPGFLGMNGVPGVPGVTGHPGFDGGCGLPGKSGDAGVAGVDGYPGIFGKRGRPGPKGQPGIPAKVDPNKFIEPGEAGEKGNAGTPGDKGFSGNNGPKGLLGDFGEDGRMGIKGMKGQMGAPGTVKMEKGEKGSKGAPGEAGPPGNVAPVPSTGENILGGEDGSVGHNGSRGDTGEPGRNSNEKGIKGELGDQGAQGDLGEAGMDGPKGVKGAIGVLGLNGAKGMKGAPGTNGFSGDKGEKGMDGPKGIRGQQGERGRDGEPIPAQIGLKGGKGPKGITGGKGAPGPKGSPGPKGAPGDSNMGPHGDPGPVGPKGERGDNGMQGTIGMIGLAGLKGERGEEGQKGSAGMTFEPKPGTHGMNGPPGPKGVKGAQGDPGPIGPKGETVEGNCEVERKPCLIKAKGNQGGMGNTGRDGDRGPAGPKGHKGHPGGPCPICPSGEQGKSGTPGLPGTPGMKGIIGQRGDVGQSGEKGKIGPKGQLGPEGSRGLKGEKGKIGETGKKGADSPGESIPFIHGEPGVPGRPGNNGSRGQKGRRGKDGDDGGPGEQGPKGYDGQKGEIGPPGEKGADANDGTDGPKGNKGEGERGPQGRPGIQGSQGKQGLIGSTGEKGRKGESGTAPNELEKRELSHKMAGEKGPQGPEGSPGLPGPPGPRGAEQGIRGEKGNKGEHGPKGYSGGPIGDKGNMGNAGTDGDPGSPGKPGKPGRRGKSGESGKAGKVSISPPGPKGVIGDKGSVGAQGPDGPSRPDCFSLQNASDIAFVMDSSKSVNEDDFDKQKLFIRKIIEKFHIGQDDTRAGVIKYGKKADIEIKFDDFFTTKDFATNINGIKHDLAKESRLDLALKLARDRLFTREAGVREDKSVEKALIILGDGFISGGGELSRKLTQNARKYAKDIKDRDILVITIGVGTEINKLLLNDFATSSKFNLQVRSYQALVDRLNNSGCTLEGIPGKDGFPGEIGDPGDMGSKGPPGDTEDGSPGSFGFPGDKGQKGDGRPGTRGDRGEKGKKGVKGNVGFRGINNKGLLGKKGQKGDRGLHGNSESGEKGAPGERGDRGRPGPESLEKLCDSVVAADVVFLLDTSSGIEHENFNKMLKFVSQIVQNFDVDNHLTRVSVITYDETVRHDIRLNDHYTKRSLLENINNLTYNGMPGTRIDKALQFAYKEAWSEENGGRAGVKQIMVMMTDGQKSYAKDALDLSEAASPLIKDRVLIYAVGIGKEINPADLKVIAGENTILADDFDALSSKIEDQISLIGRVGCKGTRGNPGRNGIEGASGINGEKGNRGEDGRIGIVGVKGPKGFKGLKGEAIGTGLKGDKGDRGDAGPQGLPGCNDIEQLKQKPATDVVFMMDASASLYEHGFEKEKDFINKVIEKVGPIDPLGLRVGVLVYGDNAMIEINLNDYFDTENFKSAVNKLPYNESTSTRIDLGLKESKKMFEVKFGARESSRKVLVVLTDGQQTFVPDAEPPEKFAKELSDRGVDVFAIGIGEEIDGEELRSIISKPKYIFLTSNLTSLVGMLVDEITQAIKCEGGPRGVDGDSGEKGPPGLEGPVGNTGDPGPQGNQGDAGSGPRGINGSFGNQGRKGDIGGKGFRGKTGFVGIRGKTGPIGPPGSKGLRGIPGEIGFIGYKGDNGPPGPKGQRGDTIGDGIEGQRGKKGEKGEKGFKGDHGRLQPGNELKDLTGDIGTPGDTGEKGVEGPKGIIRVAPGPPGPPGLTGDKGISGTFGSSGNLGKQGFKGLKGLKGVIGETGQKGKLGSTGDKGEQGSVGERGSKGKSGQIGDPGMKGVPGEVGVRGVKGFLGDIGFMGMPGIKGERGPQGPQGPQQIPKRDKQFEMIGQKGEKGRRGNSGITGELGEPGFAAAGRPGLKGPQGERGEIGGQGETGDDGISGDNGRRGPKGIKGRIGTGGDPGKKGDLGVKGEMGEIVGGGEIGDDGDIGALGLEGRPGLKGSNGNKGDLGERGQNGEQGEQGNSGFPGIKGEEGPQGNSGEKGKEGSKGSSGIGGLPGLPGKMGTAKEFGYHIVRHSQDSFVPQCPRGYEKLWEGYSLMYTVGNGHAHPQDLGDAGSCSKSFSTLPFLFCGFNGNCKYASRNDFTYWLSGEVNQTMMPVINDAVEPFISRCSVCKAPDISFAVHSQDVSTPDCPAGYKSLWMGYSFLMVAAAGKTGASQSLSSTGSCLEVFKPKPFVECQGARGTCHFFPDQYSFWLVTVDPTKEFEVQESQTLLKSKGDDLTSKVSRCRVCMRSSSSDNNVNRIENGEGNNVIRRFARSLRNFFTRN